MDSLGTQLKEVRKKKRFSLRDVEEKTGISNAYLSQLETGKISKPAPEILFKLSQIYDLTYSHLMTLAGYPMPEIADEIPTSIIHRRSKQDLGDNETQKVASTLMSLTEEELVKVREYMEFLRSKRDDK
ncbi:MAG: helix-turn-helix domain-containing protein [Candidatus Thorarchaeota archaeon]